MNVSKHCSRHVLIRSYLSRPLQITEKKLIYSHSNGFLKDFVKFNEKLKVVIAVIVVSNE